MAQALQQLSEHYANAEKNKADETRPELRAAENALAGFGQAADPFRALARFVLSRDR